MGKRKRRKQCGRILVLLLLIWAAYKYLDVGDLLPASEAQQNVLAGEWRAHGEGYEDTILVIDADSVRVIEGGKQICDEEYSLDERTMLVTGAYRQDFASFALFEYRDGEEGVNGKPLLVGSAILPDGSHEEVWFSKE